MFEAAIGYFLSALPAIISGIALLIVGWAVKLIAGFSKEHKMIMDKVKQIDDFSEDHEFLMYHASQVPDFSGEHKMLMETSQRFTDFYDKYAESAEEDRRLMKILMDSQRNQIKAKIVEIYERANDREYITPMELETLNRLAESYFELDGNSYIKAIVKHANELPIKGMEIPNH